MNSAFEIRFPSIEEIEINGDVKKYGLEKVKDITFSKNNIKDNVDCGDSECKSGGVRIFDIVEDILVENKTQDSIDPICSGYRIINGQRKSCDHQFFINVKIHG